MFYFMPNKTEYIIRVRLVHKKTFTIIAPVQNTDEVFVITL